jgi:hypothetical protein
MADVLRNDHGVDALAASAINNTPETMAMLCNWADVIVPMEPQHDNKVPDQYQQKWRNCVMWAAVYDAKRKVVDVGVDAWGNARDPRYRKICIQRVKEIIA